MNAPVRQIIFDRPPVNPALRLLWNSINRTREPAGMAADFTTPYGDIAVIDPTTPANQVVTDRSFFTQSGTSPKLVRDASGTYVWAAHNIAPNSVWAGGTTTPTGWTGLVDTGTKSLVSSIYNAPDTAIRFVEAAQRNILYFGATLVAGGLYEMSITLEALASGSMTWASLFTASGGTVVMVGCYKNGVFVTSNASDTIAAVAGDRLAYRFTVTTAPTNFYFGAGTSGNATVDITLSAPMLARLTGAAAIGYLRNTTSAALYTLAQDYDPTLGWALLVEPAATNLALQARDLSNASWTKASVTATKDVAGIDGVAASASKLVATAANGTVRQDVTSASAQRITSIFARRRVGTGAIYLSQGETTGSDLITNGTFATNDLTGWTNASVGTGTADASTGAAVLDGDAGGGNRGNIRQAITTVVGKVYRVSFSVSVASGAGTVAASAVNDATGTDNGSADISLGLLTFVATATTSYVKFFTNAAAGGVITVDNIVTKEVAETPLTLTTDFQRFSTAAATITNPPSIIRIATSGDEIDVDVVQQETGAVATSPIPTAAASVTRAQDNVRKLPSAIPSLAGAVSVAFKFIPLGVSGTTTYFEIAAPTRSDTAANLRGSSTTIAAFTGTGFSSQASKTIINPLVVGTAYNCGMVLETNNFATAVNGGAIQEDNVCVWPETNPTGEIGIGVNSDGNEPVNARILKIVIVPRAWTDAELQARTA